MYICKIPFGTPVYNCYFDDICQYIHGSITSHLLGKREVVCFTEYATCVKETEANEFILDMNFSWVRIEKHNVWFLVLTKDIKKYFV